VSALLYRLIHRKPKPSWVHYTDARYPGLRFVKFVD